MLETHIRKKQQQIIHSYKQIEIEIQINILKCYH